MVSLIVQKFHLPPCWIITGDYKVKFGIIRGEVDKSLALQRKQATGLKTCIYIFPPELHTHLWLRCSNFFNPSKKNSFVCAVNRKAKDLSAPLRSRLNHSHVPCIGNGPHSSVRATGERNQLLARLGQNFRERWRHILPILTDSRLAIFTYQPTDDVSVMWPDRQTDRRSGRTQFRNTDWRGGGYAEGRVVWVDWLAGGWIGGFWDE
jgi:hypothetical protein